MEENERHFFIERSVLDPGWIGIVKTGGPYLVLAEGLFMYLKEPDVKELLSMIHSELGSYNLVCEVTNRYWVDRMKRKYMQLKFKHQLGMTGSAIFTFGILYSRYFEEWSKNYHFIDEWTYFDDREKKLGWLRLFSSIEAFRKVQWTVHYRIEDQNDQ